MEGIILPVGTSLPNIHGFMVCVEPLFRLPEQWEWKEVKPDGLLSDSFDGKHVAYLVL
jgi:hypothetical protein